MEPAVRQADENIARWPDGPVSPLRPASNVRAIITADENEKGEPAMTSMAAWPIWGNMPAPEALHTAQAVAQASVRSTFGGAAR